MMVWYVPDSNLKYGEDSKEADKSYFSDPKCTCNDPYYKPWYSGKFAGVNEIANYWIASYKDLKGKSELFSKTFYDSTLPPEVLEAVAANLTILKSPTCLRQRDGKLWSWEGCGDNSGCCAGLMRTCMELRPGHSSSFPFAGTHSQGN
jgi:hypothetical protein